MKQIPSPLRDDMAVRFGLDPRRLTFLGGGQDWSDGTLWRHPALQPGGPEVVLKVLDLPGDDPDALVRAEDRLKFVGHLAAHGAGIVQPLPEASGALFSEARDSSKTYLAYCYPFVRGRTMEPSDPSLSTGAFYRAVGAELGRMHGAWESHPSHLRADGTCDASRVLGGWREEMAFFRGWCHEERVGRAWDRLRAALETLPIDRKGYGFIHNDAHLWNLVFDPHVEPARSGGEPRFTVIDFDVANFHWFLTDCATALYSFTAAVRGGLEKPGDLPEGFEQRVTAWFWEGYRRHRDPGAEWVARLDLFLQYRRCLLFMPFQEETAKHPEWRQHWIRRIEEEDRRLFG